MARVRLFRRDAENMTTVGFIGSGEAAAAGDIVVVTVPV